MSEDFDITDIESELEAGENTPAENAHSELETAISEDVTSITQSLREIAQENPYYFPNDVLWKRLNDDISKDTYYRSKSILNFLDHVEKPIRAHWATILFDYLTIEDRIYAFGGVPRPKAPEKRNKNDLRDTNDPKDELPLKSERSHRLDVHAKNHQRILSNFTLFHNGFSQIATIIHFISDFCLLDRKNGHHFFERNFVFVSVGRDEWV